MTGKTTVVGQNNAGRILRALGMPKAVHIVRYMHMNGWFGLMGLEDALGLERTELLVHLAALEEAGLVERKADGNALEFRIKREFPELSLTRLATEESPFLKAAKFYSNLVLGAIERSKDLNGGLQDILKLEVSKANGWHDTKAKAVLSCLEVNGPALRTYDKLRNMVSQGVLTDEDLPVLKKVFLGVLCVLIRTVETRSDKNISRLLLRVASRDLIDGMGDDIGTFGLLDGIPEEYFRQV
jgi:DNA-binding transcriptional ArsR family regulator